MCVRSTTMDQGKETVVTRIYSAYGVGKKIEVLVDGVWKIQSLRSDDLLMNTPRGKSCIMEGAMHNGLWNRQRILKNTCEGHAPAACENEQSWCGSWGSFIVSNWRSGVGCNPWWIARLQGLRRRSHYHGQWYCEHTHHTTTTTVQWTQHDSQVVFHSPCFRHRGVMCVY